MNTPVLIIGGGGHAKVLIDSLRLCSVPILGIIDADPSKAGGECSGIRIIGGDESIKSYDPRTVQLVNAVGSVRQPKVRTAIYQKFKVMGFTFSRVIHPSAIVASDCFLGEGVQIMAGVVIQPGVTIGNNALVNTRATIDHDCRIGDHAHISPGVTLSGGVIVGNGVHIGAGATVIQGVTIGAQSVIGAGSMVIDNIPGNVMAYGVPAKSRDAETS